LNNIDSGERSGYNRCIRQSPDPVREQSNEQAAVESSQVTKRASKRCFPKELSTVSIRTKLQI
jgi:hypothetical protein